MRVLVAGAVLGARPIAIPAAVEPDAEHHAVELTAGGYSVDLASPFTAMSDGLGGVGAPDNPLPELVNAMSAVPGAADGDPLADFWQQIMNYLEAAALFGLLIFGQRGQRGQHLCGRLQLGCRNFRVRADIGALVSG
ncbi:hypothetical protein [Mycolicibacter terrae]|uniref:hypothetical protein n=1 Tax=Mycolicibacter terrae TaxID=1788 RepID=UPI000B94E20F|nr:hypothetical protein [Mycolicibacter terrae]SNV61923.1 Uncharacterised protein [Mycolicibacter terrae]